MRHRLVLLLVLAVSAVLTAGCGSAFSSKPVATNQVLLPKSYRFDPMEVVVKAGTSVTWSNHDNFTHTVKVEDGVDHKISPGQSVTIKFPTLGTYRYVCTLHSHDMHGVVIVK
ncbi:MAG TPA: cupredoxin domain-containing protein [Gaiellaceae bacterium]|jgi:plastocyanin